MWRNSILQLTRELLSNRAFISRKFRLFRERSQTRFDVVDAGRVSTQFTIPDQVRLENDAYSLEIRKEYWQQ